MRFVMHSIARRRTSGIGTRAVLLGLLGLLALAPGLWAQRSEGGADDEVLSVADDVTFRSGVTEVTVPVTVTDSDGVYVNGLEGVDFAIYDNDQAQTIDSFEVAFLPISMVICVQSSARVEASCRTCARPPCCSPIWSWASSVRPRSLPFDNRVRLMQDFTADHKEIDRALKKITLGSDAVRLSDGVFEGDSDASAPAANPPQGDCGHLRVSGDGERSGARRDASDRSDSRDHGVPGPALEFVGAPDT